MTYEPDIPKTACDREAYYRAIKDAGGYEALTVLSSYSNPLGDCHLGNGRREMFTAWGTKGGEFVCENHERDGEFTYRVRKEPAHADE